MILSTDSSINFNKLQLETIDNNYRKNFFIVIKNASKCKSIDDSVTCIKDTANIGKCVFGWKKGLKLIDCDLLKRDFDRYLCTDSINGGGKSMRKGKYGNNEDKCLAFLKLHYSEKFDNQEYWYTPCNSY